MYEEDWAEYRRDRNRFFALWVLFIPVGGGLAWFRHDGLWLSCDHLRPAHRLRCGLALPWHLPANVSLPEMWKLVRCHLVVQHHPCGQKMRSLPLEEVLDRALIFLVVCHAE